MDASPRFVMSSFGCRSAWRETRRASMGRTSQRRRVIVVGVVTTDRERLGWPVVEGGEQIPARAAAAVWGRSKPPGFQ
ncbi:unnamed protein product [Brassica oleracea]